MARMSDAYTADKSMLEGDPLDRRTSGDGVQYSISEGMTDYQRYNELKDRTISVQTDPGHKGFENEIRSLEQLENKAKSKAEAVIYPLAQKLGILNRPLTTPELDIEFTYSKGNGLKESISQQLKYGGSYADFAKALLNLDTILKNAVLIEQHPDKYKGTVRENDNLINTSVLLGLFADGDTLIPVQMEIKKTADTGGHLYMTVALTKIEADVMGATPNQNGQARLLLPASNYKIADVFAAVNPSDKNFLKYVPDGFLNDAQKTAKTEALQDEKNRIAGYPKKGNPGVLPAEQFSFTGAPPLDESRWASIMEQGKIPFNETQQPGYSEALLADVDRQNPYAGRGRDADPVEGTALDADTVQQVKAEEPSVEIDNLPTKAAAALKGAEKTMARTMEERLYLTRTDHLPEIVRTISELNWKKAIELLKKDS